MFPGKSGSAPCAFPRISARFYRRAGRAPNRGFRFSQQTPTADCSAVGRLILLRPPGVPAAPGFSREGERPYGFPEQSRQTLTAAPTCRRGSFCSAAVPPWPPHDPRPFGDIPRPLQCPPARPSPGHRDIPEAKKRFCCPSPPSPKTFGPEHSPAGSPGRGRSRPPGSRLPSCCWCPGHRPT